MTKIQKFYWNFPDFFPDLSHSDKNTTSLSYSEILVIKNCPYYLIFYKPYFNIVASGLTS